MSVGIIVASFAAAPLIGRFGRTLVLAGLLATIAGVLLLWAVVRAQGTSVGPWSLVLPVFVIGLGMGTCFGTLFDIALGDIDQQEAGSASGSLSAVQQIASAIGAAVITSIWFGAIATNVPGAMIACLVVVAAILVGCCGLVTLLPRNAVEGASH
jgi:MFS family permease